MVHCLLITSFCTSLFSVSPSCCRLQGCPFLNHPTRAANAMGKLKLHSSRQQSLTHQYHTAKCPTTTHRSVSLLSTIARWIPCRSSANVNKQHWLFTKQLFSSENANCLSVLPSFDCLWCRRCIRQFAMRTAFIPRRRASFFRRDANRDDDR